MTNLPDHITVPAASSLRVSAARREVLLATYMHVYESFATDRTEVANAIFDGSKPRATSALNTLRDVQLLTATDVNESAQGSRRRGAFQEVTWQAWWSHDDINADEARELFARVFPANPTTTNGANHMSANTTARTINKTEQKELDRHSALREAWSEAFAAFETSDHPLDSAESKKLADKRDAIGAQLQGVAAKLTKRGYTLRNFDSVPVPPKESTVSATATKPAAKPAADKPAYEWPKAPTEIVFDYVTERNAPEFDADNELRPYINGNGKLFIHSEDWINWLVSKGMPASKPEAAKPLREGLGLVVRATPIPTRDYAKGFYQGDVPGELKDLARRERRAAAGGTRTRNPFAKLDTAQRALIAEALTKLPKSAVKGDREQLRDALVQQLNAADADAA